MNGNLKMKKNNIFFETFAGEFVEIVQDFEVTTSINATEEGYATEVRVPMTVTGFVMDSDGEFIYLSPDGENVNQALPINTIKHIAIVDLKDPLEEVLDDIPSPDSDKGYN